MISHTNGSIEKLKLRVSVILPLYNKASYVRRALDSISAQTFKDFEAIVVDDGSTDEGARVVAEHKDARIRLVRQSNKGPGAARNRGAIAARGEFLAFLDADDEWLPEYLEESVNLLENYGSEVAAITSGYFEYPSGASREPTGGSSGSTVRGRSREVADSTCGWPLRSARRTRPGGACAA